MAKAGWKRCFYGTLNRVTDRDNDSVVCGKIKVYDSMMYSQASNDDDLGNKLDEMAIFILDYDLFKTESKYYFCFGMRLFLN